MKILGLFLLLAGCFLIFASVVLLGAKPQLPLFELAGLGVEVTGFFFVAKAFAATSAAHSQEVHSQKKD